MKGFRALLYKEWRDQRLLVVNAAILCVVLLAVVKYFGGRRFDPDVRERYVMPALLAVFAVVLAVESLTREAQSGVERSLSRLPATRAVAWSAKIAFMALASTAFLALLTAVEHTLRLFEHYSVPARNLLAVSPTVLPLAAGVAAACFAAACVIQRSLPAAVAGVVALLAIPALAYFIPPSRVTTWLDVALNSWHPAELACMATIAFLLGSLLAFRSRRAGALGLRRAGTATFGASVVIGPTLAAPTLNSSWAFDIVPFSPEAKVQLIAPSPDARFLAVSVEQVWTPRYDWLPVTGRLTGSRCRTRREVWILDCATHGWNEIDGRFRMLADPPWDSRGRLTTVSIPGGFGDGDWRLEHIDPSTREVTEERPASVDDSIGPWYSRVEEPQGTVIRWRAMRTSIRLPAINLIGLSPEPGVVFHDEDGQLVRHTLAPEGFTRLALLVQPRRFHFLTVSPDGSMLYLHDERRILDACDGRIIREFDRDSGWCGWSEIPGRLGIVWHMGDSFSALNEDGSETPLPGFDGSCHEFGPDRLLRYDEQHIECMKLDGSEREVLYEARP